jgi:hypothetical protein
MDDPTLLAWIEKGQNFAALLVAIGVAAEFVLGFIAGPARNRISQLNETAIVELHKQASDASERAAKAELELARIKLPRSLTAVPDLIAALKQFKGTEYTFSSVFADEESINLLKQIDNVLQSAEWKRVKPPNGFPAISVYGKEQELSVPASLVTGVQVSVDSPDKKATESLAIENLPPYIKAAVTFNLNLSNLAPPQDARKVGMDLGSSSIVRIAVGKKP